MSSFTFSQRPTALNKADFCERIKFTKMEGLGNDYIYICTIDQPVKDPNALAARLSERHFGVGADGLILIGAPDKNTGYDADFSMRMFNVDGTEGEMCGNASRCVGKYVYDNKLTTKTVVNLQTKGGLRVLHLNVQNGKVASVRVNMGAPVLEPAKIPMSVEGKDFIGQPMNILGKDYTATGVSMGNPHVVVMYPSLDTLDIERIGPACEHHAHFPERVNTEFIEVKAPDRIRMRVWERGSGETLACGTGASASLVACVLNGLTDRKATVELRGGELLIEWAEDGNVYMTGPANTVFTGEFIVS